MVVTSLFVVLITKLIVINIGLISLMWKLIIEVLAKRILVLVPENLDLFVDLMEKLIVINVLQEEQM